MPKSHLLLPAQAIGHEGNVANDAERYRFQSRRHRVLADDAEVESAISELLHNFIRAQVRGGEMRAGKFIEDFSESRNHQPLNQAIAGADGERNALLLSLGAEILE